MQIDLLTLWGKKHPKSVVDLELDVNRTVKNRRLGFSQNSQTESLEKSSSTKSDAKKVPQYLRVPTTSEILHEAFPILRAEHECLRLQLNSYVN